MGKPYTKESAYDLAKVSTFRRWISRHEETHFKPEAGRYHLYAAIGCPWAHRVLIVRKLKGLERAIGLSWVSPVMVEEEGWAFGDDAPDPLHGLRFLRELYAMADPRFAGRPTVPVLWDTRERTIVNNESTDLVRMLGSEFDAFAERPGLDLYPRPLRPAIDRWNDRLQEAVNVGAYRAAMARTQADYDAAVERFFGALADLDAHLARSRFLVGDAPTEADWRLFPALVRFEWVYYTLGRCNLARLDDFPHLAGYTRELYQWPGIADTLDERATREGYFRSMRMLNPSGIVPAGPRVDFGAPHGRERLSAPMPSRAA